MTSVSRSRLKSNEQTNHSSVPYELSDSLPDLTGYAMPKHAVAFWMSAACVFQLTSVFAQTPPSAESLATELTSADLEFFETRIRPVLVQHCYECHSADSKILRGNLLLDSRDGVRKGGDSGSILGDISASGDDARPGTLLQLPSLIHRKAS